MLPDSRETVENSAAQTQHQPTIATETAPNSGSQAAATKTMSSWSRYQNSRNLSQEM